MDVFLMASFKQASLPLPMLCFCLEQQVQKAKCSLKVSS